MYKLKTDVAGRGVSKRKMGREEGNRGFFVQRGSVHYFKKCSTR